MKRQLLCLGNHITVHDTSGDYDLVEGSTPPNVPGPPPHYHAVYTELFFVLEGKMEFIVDGESVVLEAGDSIDLPLNTMHTFSNIGNAPCRWLNMHSPKGFLSFFESFGVDAKEENAFVKSIDSHVANAIMEKAASYDMHIRLP